MLNIEHFVRLKNKTTIRLGGLAPYYVTIRSVGDLLDFAEWEQNISLPFRILGGGSNLIIADESICKELSFGVLDIAIAPQENIAFVYPDELECLPPIAGTCTEHYEKFAKVTVGAGYKIPKLLKLCGENGFTGLEGLAGIPCRTGGTVAMNAGAYKTEINDVLYEVEIFNKNIGIQKISRKDIKGGYRKMHLYYQNQEIQDCIILNAAFVFPVISPQTVRRTIQNNYQTKKNTQPLQAFTAGCVFKNPCGENGEKISAGMLLDKAGLKNFRINGMRFSPVHASFLENTGNGTFNDAMELLSAAKDKILTLFNIQLEEEAKIWI